MEHPMTRPRPLLRRDQLDREEKRRLDEPLEEGLEETFPGSDPGPMSPSAALEGRTSTSSGGT